MFNAVVIGLIVVSAVWVYLDATTHKVGKIKQQGGVFNMSAGAWAVATLLIWIVAFPAYLLKRSSLIQKAEQYPITVTGRTVKASVLAFLGGTWFVLAMLGASLAALPGCTDSGTKLLVGQIIDEMPIVRAAGAGFVSLNNISELGHNQQEALRTCKATLITTLGEDDLLYVIKWSDKKAGEYYVEVAIQ